MPPRLLARSLGALLRDSRKHGSGTTPKVRLLFVALAALLVPATTYGADVSGKWQASSLRVSWAIGDWGKACGPRPSGGGEKGGPVTLTPSGADFKWSGLGRTYSTTQCWERMPDLTARSHSAGSSAIKTTCKMPAGDPRQATVVTSWYPRGNEIYFDETGQYQFVVEGSNCTASVRRTRLLTRVLDAPAAQETAPTTATKASPQASPKTEQPPAKAVKTEAPPAPLRAARCAAAGSAVHLEVTPKTKLMRVGESFTFQAVARDDAGCRAEIKTAWELLGEGQATLGNDGTLTIPADAKPGPVRIRARVQDQTVEVSARVVSEQEYEELIQGGAYGVLGESLDAATVTLSSSHVEFDRQTSAEKPDRTLLLVVLGLVVLLGGTAMYLLLRRSRIPTKPGASLREELPDVPESKPAPEAPSPPPPKPADVPIAEGPPVRLCPVCGKRYEDGTMFCVEDGARLLRAN